MKSDELIEKLAQNPFYTLSPEEKRRLDELQSEGEQKITASVVSDYSKKKLSKDNAAVKETGKLHKHPSDPVRG